MTAWWHPLAALLVGLQPPVTSGDEMIYAWLCRETTRLERSFLDDVVTREDWEKKRATLYQQYLDMLGLWPLPERTPLQATVTGRLECADFVVEKVHFQSRPRLYVTANLYLPRQVAGKVPAVLYLCGHSHRGRDGNKTAYQHHGIWFAKHGYACLVLDSLQLGEIPGIHHGTYNHARWWWHSLAYTPAGVECWNAIRAIDYLLTRPEVDGTRLAVTGRSGGGAATLWVAAADERVRVAVPVSGMSDLHTYVVDRVINGHCDCMFLVNVYRWEWTTIAALVAPRPLLFLNSGYDPIFPMAGNERIRRRLEQLYRLYTDKPEKLFDIGVTPGGHVDNVPLRLMAYRWINMHLKKDTSEVYETPPAVIPGPQLRVFAEDKDLPRDAINGRIDESFVQRVRLQPPGSTGEARARREQVMTTLRQRVFRDWPETVPAASSPRAFGPGILLVTDDPIQVHVRHASAAAGTGALKLIVLDADEPIEAVPRWAKESVAAEDDVWLLVPRGGKGLEWTRKSPPNYVERAHALLGRTVDAGRVYDVQAVARWLHENDRAGRTVTALGRGQAGILAAYAALWESAIGAVTVVEPPASHLQGPHFLGVLRYTDIPEVLGLLAPRPLTIVGVKEPWAITQAWYKQYAAEDKLAWR
ncbi:MAG: hypothetical protein C4297_00445 [Gemmataceae bacterium]